MGDFSLKFFNILQICGCFYVFGFMCLGLARICVIGVIESGNLCYVYLLHLHDLIFIYC